MILIMFVFLLNRLFFQERMLCLSHWVEKLVMRVFLLNTALFVDVRNMTHFALIQY